LLIGDEHDEHVTIETMQYCFVWLFL